MYADASGHYVFVNNGDDGLFRQWQHHGEGGRAVAAAGARFHGRLAGRGLRRGRRDGSALHRRRGRRLLAVLGEAGRRRRSGAKIDRVDGPNGLKADIEGVEVWAGKDGKGFIVLSNQGADNYAVYRREGDNAFVGMLPHRRGPGARHRRRVGDRRPRRGRARRSARASRTGCSSCRTGATSRRASARTSSSCPGATSRQRSGSR